MSAAKVPDQGGEPDKYATTAGERNQPDRGNTQVIERTPRSAGDGSSVDMRVLVRHVEGRGSHQTNLRLRLHRHGHDDSANAIVSSDDGDVPDPERRALRQLPLQPDEAAVFGHQ